MLKVILEKDIIMDVHVDVAENLANERLKKLFNCKYANSQPHSGAQANGAVFLAIT